MPDTALYIGEAGNLLPNGQQLIRLGDPTPGTSVGAFLEANTYQTNDPLVIIDPTCSAFNTLKLSGFVEGSPASIITDAGAKLGTYTLEGLSGLPFTVEGSTSLSAGGFPFSAFTNAPASRPVLTYSRSGAGETAAAAAMRVALSSLGIVQDNTTT